MNGSTRAFVVQVLAIVALVVLEVVGAGGAELKAVLVALVLGGGFVGARLAPGLGAGSTGGVGGQSGRIRLEVLLVLVVLPAAVVGLSRCAAASKVLADIGQHAKLVTQGTGACALGCIGSPTPGPCLVQCVKAGAGAVLSNATVVAFEEVIPELRRWVESGIVQVFHPAPVLAGVRTPPALLAPPAAPGIPDRYAGCSQRSLLPDLPGGSVRYVDCTQGPGPQ